MSDRMIAFTIEKILERLDALEAQNKELKFQFTALKNTVETNSKTDAPKKAEQRDELLVFGQVRKILNLSRNSINKLIATGKLRLIRLNDSSLRFSSKEIQALIGAK